MSRFAYNFAGAGAVVADSVAVAANGNITMGSGAVIKVDASNSTSNCPIQRNGDPNTGITFPAADQVSLVTGGGAPVAAVVGGASISTLTVTSNLVNLGALYLKEMAAPAGLADYGILYAVVDGGGKTDLFIIFQSGAAIKIAEEA